jgi:DNA-directed RNA polymerase specialized sigma24 family protein
MSVDPLDSKASFVVSDSSTGPGDVERLFREHNSALLRFVVAKVGSEEEAREIAQQAYVQLLQLDRPEAISYLRAFLFKTAANLAVGRAFRVAGGVYEIAVGRSATDMATAVSTRLPDFRPSSH